MKDIMTMTYSDENGIIVKKAVLQYIPKSQFNLEFLKEKELKELQEDEYFDIMAGYYRTVELKRKNHQDNVSIMNKSGRILTVPAIKAFKMWKKSDCIILDF